MTTQLHNVAHLLSDWSQHFPLELEQVLEPTLATRALFFLTCIDQEILFFNRWIYLQLTTLVALIVHDDNLFLCLLEFQKT
jgi:hypothetical protein